MAGLIDRANPAVVLVVDLAMIADEADAPDVALWMRSELLYMHLIAGGTPPAAARRTADGAADVLRKARTAVEQQRKTHPPD
jgi:hypothetical protein